MIPWKFFPHYSYVEEEELNTLSCLLDGVDKGDAEKTISALDHPFIKNLDLEYTKIARNLKLKYKSLRKSTRDSGDEDYEKGAFLWKWWQEQSCSDFVILSHAKCLKKCDLALYFLPITLSSNHVLHNLLIFSVFFCFGRDVILKGTTFHSSLKILIGNHFNIEIVKCWSHE